MSGAPDRWVLASSNANKLRELCAIAEGRHLRILAQGELGISAAPETAGTFVENALIKARHAAEVSGLPAIADDSGLIVDALGGAPGVLSARFAGPNADDEANLRKLLGALRGVPEAERTAQFVCVMVALLTPDDPAPLIHCGRWNGRIALEVAGSNGFGYDPVFFDPRQGRTAAELAPETKNRISHRSQAWIALSARLAASRLRPR